MAKKEFNAQDIFFESEQAFIEDRYPHRGKDPNAMKGFYKFMEQKRPKETRSDKGFTNTITMPFVTDVEKRDKLESQMDNTPTMGVFVDTDEGQIFYRSRDLEDAKNDTNSRE